MKNMKIAMLVIQVLIVSFVNAQNKKPLIVASASIFADMARNIGGELIDVRSIVPIGGDPHLFEPTPSSAQLVQKADLILINGLTFEGWIKELIENSGTKAETFLITQNVIPISSVDHKGATDPHAWMTASNGLIYIKNIYTALKGITPTSQHSFLTKNYEVYKAKLEFLDQYIFARIKEIPEGKRVLVTSHDAFNYYGARYGLTLNAILGISTESEAQIADMKRVVASIKENDVPAIFIESTVNPKLVKQIADDTGVKIGGELFADSIGDENSEAPTYYDLLKHNTDIIANALTGTSLGQTKLDNQGKGINSAVILGIIVFLGATIIFMVKMLDRNHNLDSTA
jgi:ABC-type Zn uptake system ZnuABC Zn-binding protein ZnuA